MSAERILGKHGLYVTIECIESPAHIYRLLRHKYPRSRRYTEHYRPRRNNERSSSGNASRYLITMPSGLTISTAHAMVAEIVGDCGTFNSLKSTDADSLPLCFVLYSHLLRVDNAMLWVRENARRVIPLRWNSAKISARSAEVLLLCLFFPLVLSVSMCAAYRCVAILRQMHPTYRLPIICGISAEMRKQPSGKERAYVTSGNWRVVSAPCFSCFGYCCTMAPSL
jgi:hypothetical protein